MLLLPPWDLLQPKRKITGMSAILLPYTATGVVDWEGFEAHVTRTVNAGLAPAINMDTGYAQLIDEETREQVLQRTQRICQGREFVAGAYVGDKPGSRLSLDGYLIAIDQIQSHGGTPVIFPSYGFKDLPECELPEFYYAIAKRAPRFIAFELGEMFVPCGRIFTLETYKELLQIKECVGAKHSSLSRQLEWERLRLKNELRPDFMVLTGNDLAIDMVMFGSDYLLGLSTFDPVAFALRDKYWQEGDPRFLELNDLLQYLGQLTFRSPVPGYKHNAAQFLHLRSQIASNLTHPQAVARPESDMHILADISERLYRLTTQK